MGFARRLLVLFAALIAVSVPSAAIAAPHSGNATASRLVTGLQGGLGSTIGPDGALYVTETAAGRITRVDPQTGATTTYADGLPKSIIGVGGAMDIAFLGNTAYVLVTLVGPDVGRLESVPRRRAMTNRAQTADYFAAMTAPCIRLVQESI